MLSPQLSIYPSTFGLQAAGGKKQQRHNRQTNQVTWKKSEESHLAPIFPLIASIEKLNELKKSEGIDSNCL